jgi:hypothetical protein
VYQNRKCFPLATFVNDTSSEIKQQTHISDSVVDPLNRRTHVICYKFIDFLSESWLRTGQQFQYKIDSELHLKTQSVPRSKHTPYRAVNTLCLGYENQSVNAV